MICCLAETNRDNAWRSGDAPRLKLTPANAGGDRGTPNWACFPRQPRLLLEVESESDIGWVRELLGQLPSTALAAVGSVSIGYFSNRARGARSPSYADAWGAALKRLPGVTRISMRSSKLCGEEDAPLRMDVIATITSATPNLVQLHTWLLAMDEPCAALISARLPNLRSLEFGRAADTLMHYEPGGEAMWPALPVSRLTALRMREQYYGCIPHPVLQGARWPQLRKLGGFCFPEEHAQLRAVAMPNLEVLGFEPTLERDGTRNAPWPDSGVPVLCGVKWAQVERFCPGFERSGLMRMLPSLERLVFRRGGSYGAFECDLGPLTNLTHLDLDNNYSMYSDPCVHGFAPHTWHALCALPRLSHLALGFVPGDLGLLAGLSATLEVLRVRMMRDHRVDAMRGPEPIDLSAVIAAAQPLRRLRTLQIEGPGAEGHINHGRLARLVSLASLGPPLLRELAVAPQLRLHDVALLAALPGLRRLLVWPHVARSGADPVPPDFKLLAAQHERCGLRIRYDGWRREKFEDIYEGW